MQRRDALILAGVGLAAAAAGILVGPMVLQSQSGAAELHAASYPDLAGSIRRIDSWKGSALVCNFWATWCAPCREEMPLLQATRQKYAEKWVEIVGIGIDNADKIRQFAAEFGISYPLLVADSGGIELMRNLGNRDGALPFTVILDRHGAIASRRLGILRKEDLETALDGVLR